MACSALQLISTQPATVVLVLHRRGDAVVLDVHEGPLDLLVRRRGLELGHEVAVARGAGLVGLRVDRGLRENQSASGLLSSGIIESTRMRIAHLGLGRVVQRRLAAAHRLLRRAHEPFHCLSRGVVACAGRVLASCYLALSLFLQALAH